MYIKINNVKYEIVEFSSRWEKFKSLKFVLEPLDKIIKMKKKSLSTYFFCQRVDVIMTDADNKILYIYNSFRSEKFIFWKRKVSYTYLLPNGVASNFKVNDKFEVKKRKWFNFTFFFYCISLKHNVFSITFLTSVSVNGLPNISIIGYLKAFSIVSFVESPEIIDTGISANNCCSFI